MAIKQYIKEFEQYNKLNKGFTARNKNNWNIIAPKLADFITMIDGRKIDETAVLSNLEKIYV